MESRASRPLQIVLWGVLAVALIAITLLFIQARQSRSHLPEYFAVQPFTLTNQLNQAVSLRDLHGRVWVADIIFTRCPGPCPRMTEEMARLQSRFAARDDFRLVTLTTDPEFDTPAVLERYAGRFKADPSRWYFLTGPKSEIGALAQGSLKLGAEEKKPDEQQNPADLFIHSTVFVLVDKAGKVRGFYESLEEGFQDEISAAIESLLREKR